MITGKLYDYLKWLAQVVLPALGALYVALASLWGLPSAEAVAGTILAVDTFLGVVLGISQISYAKSDKRFDGSMDVRTVGDKKTFLLAFDDERQLEALKGEKKEVLFKVNHE
jgi:hypothetical protein